MLERIEADARATDRGLAAAAAQAAGARATAWLLAALPLGGIGLGYGIGVDPMAVLLHSTVGGACAVVAVALQVVGLLWAERLGATPGTEPACMASPAPWSAGASVVERAASSVSQLSRPAAAAGRDPARRRRWPGSRWPSSSRAGSGCSARLPAAFLLDVLLRRIESPAVRKRRLQEAADLPLAADLLAAAMRAGAPVDRSVLAVAEALDGPLAGRLARVGRTLLLGGGPAEAWSRAGRRCPARSG